MSSFLKLRDCLLNTRYIHHIKISPDKYDVHMKGNLSGVFLCASGSLYEDYRSFVVEKENHREDYDKITKWISNSDN